MFHTHERRVDDRELFYGCTASELNRLSVLSQPGEPNPPT